MVGRKNTMRTSPQAEIPMPITYTPTTHRISKAKKGKRVHACEYPGCNKVGACITTRIRQFETDLLLPRRSSLVPSTADAMSSTTTPKLPTAAPTPDARRLSTVLIYLRATWSDSKFSTVRIRPFATFFR